MGALDGGGCEGILALDASHFNFLRLKNIFFLTKSSLLVLRAHDHQPAKNLPDWPVVSPTISLLVGESCCAPFKGLVIPLFGDSPSPGAPFFFALLSHLET